MKHLIALFGSILILVGFILGLGTYACNVQKNKVSTVDSTAYYKAKFDSVSNIIASYEMQVVECRNRQSLLSDSLSKYVNAPVMSIGQFVKLYKYERLLKYYNICRKKPSQWKYYKGWSRRVFEQ